MQTMADQSILKSAVLPASPMPLLGWESFRKDYGASTWQWLAAATKPRSNQVKQKVMETLGSSQYTILKADTGFSWHLDLWASQVWSTLQVFVIQICLLIDAIAYKTEVWWFSQYSDRSGQLGIDRERINVYYNIPSRLNVFLQTRNVKEIVTE